MTDDERCCGSGHCMINAEGQCWCGQRWDGSKMCHPAALEPAQTAPDAAPDSNLAAAHVPNTPINVSR